MFPHYELPFTGGLPGTFPGLQSVIPGSGPFGVVNTAATHGDDPDNPRDPDRFEPVSSGQTETRKRFVPSGLTAEIFRNVFIRPASFLPGVSDVGERLLRAPVGGDGRASFLRIVRNTCYGWRRHGYQAPTDSSYFRWCGG